MALTLKTAVSLSLWLVALSAAFSGSARAQVTQNMLDQNADGSQGQYMPMNLNYAGFNSLGMVQSAWLDPLQNLGEGQSKPAYSRYYWSPDLVLPVRLREGMITLVNFPEWELIQDIFIGDAATFDGQISGPNTLLLYPRKGAQVGVDTNIAVFGRSGNRYMFYVKSEGINTERLTNAIIDIEVVDSDASGGGSGASASGAGGAGRSFGGGSSAANFTKSGGKSAAAAYTRRFQKNDWIKEIPVDASKFRFDIETYSPNPDDVIIAPERVWRDDIFTYIDLGEKALSMTQRPIVTLIVERIEVPVGFRSKGPNNRLIIVEGIGDLVLRSGKRIICLKLRRADSAGLEYMPTVDSDENFPREWEVPRPLPEKGAGYGNPAGKDIYGNPDSLGARESAATPSLRDMGAGIGGVGGGQPGMAGQGNAMGQGAQLGVPGSRPGVGGSQSGVGGDIDYAKMQRISNDGSYDDNARALLSQYGFGSGLRDAGASSISVELGTDADISRLEGLWSELSAKYADSLGAYEPFFSVDAPADGQGRELFHLRIGPVESIDRGDKICSRLGRNGIFCSVVRTQ